MQVIISMFNLGVFVLRLVGRTTKLKQHASDNQNFYQLRLRNSQILLQNMRHYNAAYMILVIIITIGIYL